MDGHEFICQKVYDLCVRACVCVCGRRKAYICMSISCKQSSITSFHFPQELQVKNNRGHLFCVTQRLGGLRYLRNGFTQRVAGIRWQVIKRANVWQNLPVSTIPFIFRSFQDLCSWLLSFFIWFLINGWGTGDSWQTPSGYSATHYLPKTARLLGSKYWAHRHWHPPKRKLNKTSCLESGKRVISLSVWKVLLQHFSLVLMRCLLNSVGSSSSDILSKKCSEHSEHKWTAKREKGFLWTLSWCYLWRRTQTNFTLFVHGKYYRTETGLCSLTIDWKIKVQLWKVRRI